MKLEGGKLVFENSYNKLKPKPKQLPLQDRIRYQKKVAVNQKVKECIPTKKGFKTTVIMDMFGVKSEVEFHISYETLLELREGWDNPLVISCMMNALKKFCPIHSEFIRPSINTLRTTTKEFTKYSDALGGL